MRTLKLTIGLAALAVALMAAPTVGAAASLTVLPRAGTADTIDDTGGCDATGCIPLGLTGYISGGVTGAGPELRATPGVYRFTYLGNGNAADDDIFTLGGRVIHWDDPIGASFAYAVGAGGALPFTYTNLTTGASITDGAVNPTQELSYGLYPVNPWLVYIGLSDLPYVGAPGDHDFQDLAIRVTIPEPATWIMMLAGFAALGVPWGVRWIGKRAQA